MSNVDPRVALASTVSEAEPLSRKQFLHRAAALVGGVAGFGLLDWTRADAAAPHPTGGGYGAPNPIPGGFGADFSLLPSDPFIHVLPPAVGLEMSTITDFNGVVAAAEIQGMAHGSDDTTYWFDADMRFMSGAYIDEHGRHREHAFGFV